MESYQAWKSSGIREKEAYRPHPYKVRESTILANVPCLLPPVTPTEEGIDTTDFEKGLSTLQIETVDQCLAAFRYYGGFFLADGPGVGKGRTIAGIIARTHRQSTSGCRALWVSPQASLRADASRDLGALLPGWEVIDDKMTPQREPERKPPRAEVAFVTYASLRYRDRKLLTSLQRWLEESQAQPVIVFDEAHCVTNTRSLTFAACHELQTSIPSARVVYSSATMANDVGHMAILERVGLFGRMGHFDSHEAFVKAIHPHGSAGLELVAVDLKQR